MQLFALIYKLSLLVIYSSLITVVCDADPTKLRALEKRQQLYPSNLKVKYVLARAYANRGKADPRFYDKSINKLQEILKIKQIAVVKFYLGLMHARKGNLDRAINQWTTIARSLKPNNLTTLRYLALVHEKKGEFPQSLKYWNKVLSIAPANYKAHYHAALVTLKTLSIEKNLRYSNAIRHFKKVLARYPEHKKTLWYLNLTYKGSRQFLNQRKILNQLLVFAPKNQRLRREYKVNIKNLKAQPVDAVLKVPKKRVEPVEVSVSTEITEDEFNAVFSKDPEPQEVPEVHEPEAVDQNPTLPIDSPLSADAELLFNQGVQYMQNKEYDLALFNFLQAQELDPKFAQCYMQIGEVYLKLADSTPTEDKFLEHLQLSEQALETAVQLEPDSLLAHASRAKQKEIQEKRNLGFEKTHLKVAKRAIESGDIRYAVEEYIILMTNNFVSSELIFSLSSIYDKVDEGVKLDLNNVLLTASSEGKLGAIYLESKFKVDVDEDRAFDLVDRMFTDSEEQVTFFKNLKIHLDQNQGDNLDDFIMGRYLLNAQSYGPASKWLQSAVKKSSRDSLKKRMEPYLSKSLKGNRMRQSSTYSGGIKPHKSPYELFQREKTEIISAQATFKSIFEEDSNLGLLEEKRQLLVNWTTENPTNMLGKYILGLILEKSSLEESQQQAINYKSESVMAHKEDSDWHFKMGLLALKLNDLQWAERFIEQAEFITLKRGWEIYNPYALHASKLAHESILNNRLDLARGYIKYGFRFHPYSKDLATIESSLIEKS
ncbi:MAG: tetratricopeptide repeat protein, partial [bacterium]|nr:tetratricopeptide repeat protein [bacterium]